MSIVLSPEGRRFLTLYRGYGPKAEPMIRLRRLDRKPREQSHIWRPVAEVDGWKVLTEEHGK